MNKYLARCILEIQQMSESDQLNVNKTFDSQKGLVTAKIILTLLKELDFVNYLIGEGVLYKMIY